MSEVDDADGIPVTAAATFCATLVDEWRRQCNLSAVISPGSRSTPMALALLDAASRGVRVHVCLDERSAGFVALGIARVTGWPTLVLTTSGTATANLHPAVAEASHDAVPMIVLTADRPPELHGVGAPQTIDQQHLFGGAVRAFIDAGVPDDTDPATWRSLAATVWRSARGERGTAAPGPVQLNLPFREPLVGRAGELSAPGPRTSTGRRATEVGRSVALGPLVAGQRVVVVAGPPMEAHDQSELFALAERLAWPVLVDPRLGVPAGPIEYATGPEGTTLVHDPQRGFPVGDGLRRADLLLRSTDFVAMARPDVVLRVGALPASKVMGQWLDGLGIPQLGFDPWGRRSDPGGSLTQMWSTDTLDADGTPAGSWFGGARELVHALESIDEPAPAPDGWLDLWTVAEREAEAVLTAELSSGPLTEPAVARLVTEVARDQQAELFVSSSMPIRDVEWFGVPDGPALHANRGANGIDGVTSTAAGVALGSGHRTLALLGDLAFLHDTNGLLTLNSEQPDLTLVVVDNGGGGIFHFLPQRDALDRDRFERLYGTPQNVDLVAVAEAHGVPAQRCDDRDTFEAELRATTRGPRVLVVTTDRDANVAEHLRLQKLVVAAVDATLARRV